MGGGKEGGGGEDGTRMKSCLPSHVTYNSLYKQGTISHSSLTAMIIMDGEHNHSMGSPMDGTPP